MRTVKGKIYGKGKTTVHFFLVMSMWLVGRVVEYCVLDDGTSGNPKTRVVSESDKIFNHPL